MYCGYVTTIRQIRKHGNADRLQVATIFGNDTIVDLSYHEGQRIVYFPVDGQLSEEFCADNNLVRKLDENGNNVGGYLDPNKRNITAIKLRGEKSDGLVLPIEVLAKYTDIEKLADGTQITEIDGHEICRKYIPRSSTPIQHGPHNKAKSAKPESKEKFPFFVEHIDTEQLAYNEKAFKPGDTCYITLKMHGTSARTANAISVAKKKQNIFQRVFHLNPGETRTYRMVSGTRRTTLRNFEPGGYYGDNDFRKKWHDFFAERLPKGVEVFYEIVGWVSETTPIMGRCKNSLIKDKEFSKQYGDETVFNYGCAPGECDCYVYRMTMTNDDGFCVEIPWEETKLLCEKMGVKHVPEFEKFIYTTWEDLMERVEKYYDGPDPIGKTHVREGVVVRLADREVFEAYKHKNFSFKVLSHVILDNTNPDEVSADMLSEM